MTLTESAISWLMHGDVSHLPLELQILDIRLLTDDDSGIYMARLQLSDGKNHYAGFVVDVSLFQSLNANVYAIVRINKLTIFEHSQKYVVKIDEIELIVQEDKSLGNPIPYIKETNNISSSSPTNNIQFDTQAASVSQQSNNSTTVISIDQLSSVGLTRSAIQGLITRKSELRTYSNGTGKFFTFDIADFHSEIRCKAFNDVVSMFFETISTGQAYQISNFMLNRSNKQYNHLPHQMEINLTKYTIIFPIFNAYQNLRVASNLVKISTLSLDSVGACVDVFVSIKSINETDLIYVPKKNKYSLRRIITAADDSGTIDIVLWNDFAKMFSGTVDQNATFKDLLIEQFKGKLQLATTMVSLISLEQ